MKIISILLFATFFMLSCDESEKGITVTDYRGVSIELFWKGIEPKNRDGIGLTVYGPDGNLYYQNFDSLTFSYSTPDGRFTIQAEIFSKLENQVYNITVKGLDSDVVHTFENSFNPNDGIGTSKTSLFMTTDEYNYTFERP